MKACCARPTLTEASALVERSGEQRWVGEIHRLKGELILAVDPSAVADAESCFQRAMTIARTQSAASLELRAATSLAGLWRSNGRRDEARALLSPVFGWFTEGVDTADLKDAKELLDQLDP
jgi:predicted ATPase